MPQQNVEVVRQAFIATSGGDTTAAQEAFDPAVEWDMSGVTGWVEQEVYRGPQVMTFLEGWRQSWEGWHFEVEEVHEGAGGQVFAGIHELAKGADTGVSVDQRRYFAIALCAARILRVRMFSDRSEALKAAGLEG